MKDLIKNIEQDKGITKNLKKLNYYTAENMANDIKTYIKAIKEGRMIIV